MKKVFLTLWVVLNIASPLLTQEYAFQSLTVEDGLSQSSVTCLAQDHKGFLWIGTRDGLNRYNGDEFKVFRKIPFDTNSLQSNVITSLLVDDFNSIYVGTIKGLQRYDLISSQFTSIPLILNNAALDIRSIYKDRSGAIWVATENGFFKVVRDSTNGHHHVSRYVYQSEAGSATPLAVHFFFHDSSNNFWVSTSLGILKIPYPELQQPENRAVLEQITGAFRYH